MKRRTAGVDADALAYITAVESTGYTMSTVEKNAIIALVGGFKANGTWAKKRAVYPMTGNTAASQKWNLLNPLDTDAAFRLTYTGTITRSLPLGMKFNAASGSYADTHLTDTALGTNTDVYMSVWGTDDVREDTIEAGVRSTNLLMVQTHNGTIGMAGSYNGLVSGSVPNAIGLSTLNYTGAAGPNLTIYRNGVHVGANNRSPMAAVGRSLTIGALFTTGSVEFPSNKAIGFAEFGKTQTSTETVNDYNTIFDYMSAVGRLPVLHADTQAAITWLTDIGETLLPSEVTALDRLVRDLHGETNAGYATSDIWAKFTAAYPFVGATAGSHSLNLKAPGTFTLTYEAGVTHGLSGMYTNNLYANTGIVPASHLLTTDKHLSLRQEAPAPAAACMGNITHINGSWDGITVTFPVTGIGIYLSDANDFFLPATVAVGFAAATRRNSSSVTALTNGVINNGSSASIHQTTAELRIGAFAAIRTSALISWSSIGASLTDTEMLNLELAANAYRNAVNYHADTKAAIAWLMSFGETVTATEANALDRLVKDLHGEPNTGYATSDIWNKFIGIYPMIGASAAKHSLNLRTPGAFALSFDAGVTHDAAGTHVSPTALAHTGIVSNTHLSRINKHISMHQSQAVTVSEGYQGMGNKTFVSGSFDAIGFVDLTSALSLYGHLSESAAVPVNISPGNARSFIGISRLDETTLIVKAAAVSTTSPQTALPAPQHTDEITIGAPTALGGGNFTFDWATVGFGLTGTELLNLQNAWYKYQTSLSRTTTLSVPGLVLILGLLLSLGITLTQEQIDQLNEILVSMPAPTPAPGMEPPPAPEYASVEELPTEVTEYLRSEGFEL